MNRAHILQTLDLAADKLSLKIYASDGLSYSLVENLNEIMNCRKNFFLACAAEDKYIKGLQS